MQYYEKKAVGERIKKIRQSRGLTQCRLAEELDYTSERQLQRIESGATSCSVDKLMELAQILEVSTDYLLFGWKKRNVGVFQKYFEGKTKGQIEYLGKILEVAAANLDLLGERL